MTVPVDSLMQASHDRLSGLSDQIRARLQDVHQVLRIELPVYLVLTKTDLLPHLSFDVQRCMDYARRVNPGIRILQLSATTGEGMDAWLDWLLHPDAIEPTSVQTRIAQLEAELARLRSGQG